jgi:uncharacterized membrane protein YkvA (DUF1232 family)
MPLEITFTLSDDDLDRFQAIVDAARKDRPQDQAPEDIESAARALIADSRNGQLPGYISERLERLDVVIQMINDEEWQLSKEEIERVIGVLAYLCDPEDMIPDDLPALGFLDDAIYAEIVFRELKSEISLYAEFCEYRKAEEDRRRQNGDEIQVGREDWLADKRAALHKEMRRRRGGKTGWNLKFWK